jgi:hypothetical protein
LITIISSLLTIYTWVVVCVIVFFLFAIARFYQEKSGQNSYFAVFLVPIGLFAISTIIYAFSGAPAAGFFWGDVLRAAGGGILIVASYYLLNLMVGKK